MKASGARATASAEQSNGFEKLRGAAIAALLFILAAKAAERSVMDTSALIEIAGKTISTATYINDPSPDTARSLAASDGSSQGRIVLLTFSDGSTIQIAALWAALIPA
jgi:uncharacterized MAPEG superfamily protein